MISPLLDTRKATQCSTELKEKFRQSSELIRHPRLLTARKPQGGVDLCVPDMTELHRHGFLLSQAHGASVVPKHYCWPSLSGEKIRALSALTVCMKWLLENH